MKKIFYFCAVSAAMLLTACSSDESTTPPVAQNAPQAVAFDTYVPNATRAGQTDVMSTSTLQSTGFGVFAYKTEGDYTNTVNPNFMYNQKVTYSSSAWEYSPLKYWPNNTANDMDNAEGHATTTVAEKVSFFAYAPYVNAANDPSVTESGWQVGITGFSENNSAGDPTVGYKVATVPSNSVDLLWGVAPSAGLSYSSVASSTTDINIASGKPLTNLLKPAKDQKMKFMFQHALARLGLSVVAAVDQVAAGGNLDEKTKIVIEKVVIKDYSTVDACKLATTADLNLNNATANVANWTNKNINTTLELTIDNNNELESSLQWVPNGTAIKKDDSFKKGGVTTYEKPLIGNNKYFMLIPNDASNKTGLEVEITYYVLTRDEQLADKYSVVKNVITKKVQVAFESGKAYNLKLILGLTSVKLDAEVANWVVGSTTDVDLPKNN